MEEVITVHYDEIALKGKNRPVFQRKLIDNIVEKMGAKTELRESRLIIHNADAEAYEKLRLTPGVSWYAKGLVMERDYNKLEEVLKDLVSMSPERNLNLDVKRADKGFEDTSLELKGRLCKNLRIKLDKSARKVRVDIMHDLFIINYDIERGIGGLPVGTAGKVISLFSGGIDSAVAPIEIMKRGAKVDLLHVYALPSHEAALNQKINRLASRIAEVGGLDLYLVPFHVFSMKTIDVDSRYELVLFKRFLLKLADSIARNYGYKAICSGDALSQVASQTLDNINAVSYGIDTPVLRPLIGYNKEEIILKAKRYGTYDISIEDYKDCCSITSRNPATSVKREKLEEIEKKVDMDAIVEKSIEKINVKTY